MFSALLTEDPFQGCANQFHTFIMYGSTMKRGMGTTYSTFGGPFQCFLCVFYFHVFYFICFHMICVFYCKGAVIIYGRGAVQIRKSCALKMCPPLGTRALRFWPPPSYPAH